MSLMKSPTLFGQCLSEFLGTALLVFFGLGCVAAVRIAGAQLGLWEVSIIWGLGVALAVYLTAGISGAHLNLAVTLALWLFACFERRKVIPYIVAQFLGGFAAAALVYAMYYNVFLDYDQVHHIVRGSQESLFTAGFLHLSGSTGQRGSGVLYRSGDRRYPRLSYPGTDR